MSSSNPISSTPSNPMSSSISSSTSSSISSSTSSPTNSSVGSALPFFERMMTLHHETFQDAHYSAAYHLLAAALHCADDARDTHQLALIGTVATNQLAWIDANAPAYEHSTQSAARRGHASIYSMLARQAQGKVLIWQRKQHIEAHFLLDPRAPNKPEAS